ncbi:MAG: lamin tail domain-containing protein [Pirellulales bacterium]
MSTAPWEVAMARSKPRQGKHRLTVESLEPRLVLSAVSSALRVTELMYNPPAPPTGPYLADDFEFIELANTGDATLDLTGVQFTQGVTFDFTGSAVTSLAPGQFVVIVRNQAAFASRYNTAGMAIAGQYGGGLTNGGEQIKLVGLASEVIQDFTYSNLWQPLTDGNGFSLAPIDAKADVAKWNDKDGWRASAFSQGSPGAVDFGYAPNAVVINELLAHTDEAIGDWIELRNTTSASIDIGGWFLSDHPADLKKYKIAAGTTIPAGGYKVFTQFVHFDNPADPGTATPFAFSELGESAYLTSGDAAGNLGGYREDAVFGASEREVSFGRYTKSTGKADFVAMSSQTRGDANAYPKIGPVVVNELMYNPPAGGDEYIELYNASDADAPLYDPAHPENTWKFADGIDYTFPAGTVVPARGYLLVVAIDPAAFRAKYAVSAGVPIMGPYAGSLANDGETIDLLKPYDPEMDGFVPMPLVERVNYGDKSPWPDQPDGNGAALSRVLASDYANDPANWKPGVIGGTPGAANRFLDTTPPAVISSNCNNGAAQRSQIVSLAIQFSENVAASLDAGDLTLHNDTTGIAVNIAGVVPTYDPVTNRATWNLAGVTLDDANYTATLSKSGVTDAAGNPLASKYTLAFFRLLGDTNGDRAVDIFDVANFQLNYGQSGGMTPAQGDLDGDADVDIFDVAALQTQYGKILAAPPAPSPPAESPPAAAPPAEDAGGTPALQAPADETPALQAPTGGTPALQGEMPAPQATLAPQRKGETPAEPHKRGRGAGAGGQEEVRTPSGSRGEQGSAGRLGQRETPAPQGLRLRRRAGHMAIRGAFAAVDQAIESGQFRPSKWDDLLNELAASWRKD